MPFRFISLSIFLVQCQLKERGTVFSLHVTKSTMSQDTNTKAGAHIYPDTKKGEREGLTLTTHDYSLRADL